MENEKIMGNEIKRDMCPEKYYAKGSVIKDSLPTIIALVIVAFFSGSLFNGSGLNIAITILIEAVFVCLMYSFVFLMFKGMKKRLAETYISVCENGICGVCPLNGYKNRSFSVTYDDIKKVVVKGERVFIYTTSGNIALTLRDAAATAALVQSHSGLK